MRVAASGGPSSAKLSAFRNVDGKVVMQIIQGGTGAGSIDVKVNGFKAKTGRAYITDNTHDCSDWTVSLGADGASASAQVPGRSFVTIVLEPV